MAWSASALGAPLPVRGGPGSLAGAVDEGFAGDVDGGFVVFGSLGVDVVGFAEAGLVVGFAGRDACWPWSKLPDCFEPASVPGCCLAPPLSNPLGDFDLVGFLPPVWFF